MDTRKRLLINWVYYQPVGHAIEAFRYGQAFRNRNPDLEIAIVLNARSAVELGQCLPAIDAVYAVDLDEFEQPASRNVSLERIPQAWDYVFTDPRHQQPMGWGALDQFEREFRAYIHAGAVNDGWSWGELPPATLSPLVLRLPKDAAHVAEQFLGPEQKTRISLLMGSGTDACRTPPISFWCKLIQQLVAAFANVEIVLLGALDQRRSVTKGLIQDDIDRIMQEFPQVRNAFDLGLLNQLALAERCSLHISPHTGMSFAIQCVGVPWLVLSGGEVAEYIVNGVPFVSIYPDCDYYPCGRWFAPQKNPMLPECLARQANDQPWLCMTGARLEQKLPAILAAARALLNNELSYQACVRKHYAEMIPRLGKKQGEPFMEGWPSVLEEDFIFRREV
jgi:hypothetical protein